MSSFTIDAYSKIILTVIAVALVLLAIQPLLPQTARAQIGEVEVYITNPGEIARAIARQTLDVNVVNAGEIGMAVDLWSD